MSGKQFLLAKVKLAQRIARRFAVVVLAFQLLHLAASSAAEILTPAPPAQPRINGARVFGVRPESPFLFTIPFTGEEPVSFSAEGLPEGLSLDPVAGRITGKLSKP
ncbi:MAG TPA: hypothetical protein VFE46_13370, partial [Pirellulales bacterium]|nr:hypothetical protein [Pirellulales bacterium]